MSPRRHWSDEAARRIVQLTTGLSVDVQTTYLASELRMAFSRGQIEATRATFNAAKSQEKLV